MRSRGTKEIVPTSDGRGFIALLENGELWRFNSMISSWVRELNPEEMATREKITPRSAAEQLAEEDQRFAKNPPKTGSHYRNPRSVDMDQGYQKHAEAPRTAQEAAEAETWVTVSISETDRLEVLSQANRIAGSVATMADVLGLARWVIARFGPPSGQKP